MAQDNVHSTAIIDSNAASLITDSASNDSVIVIRKQAVVRKQVQLTYQTIIDTVYKHHLSILANILQMPTSVRELHYQSPQTSWTLDQAKRYDLQFRYHHSVGKRCKLGAGLSLSQLSYQLHYQNSRSQEITTRRTKIDTLEVYYIEENNVPKPHYIIRNTSILHTDTITNTRHCDTLTRIYHLGIPLDCCFPIYSNLFTIVSLHATVEPSVMLSARGATAQTDSLHVFNTDTRTSTQLSTEIGILASLLVTEQLSVDCSLGYRHSFLAAATMLPSNFMKQQMYMRFGVSYSF